MSTKELLYSMIDKLTEQQMQELITLLSENNPQNTYRDEVYGVMGALKEYADPRLIPLENDAWEKEVKARYENDRR